MNLKRTALVLSLVLHLLVLSRLVSGQERFELQLFDGHIYKHNEKLDQLSPGPVKGFSLNYILPGDTTSPWLAAYHSPEIGAGYRFISYNNPGILGNSHALISFMRFFLLRNRWFESGFQATMGPVYQTRKFHETENPYNYANGSHFNLFLSVNVMAAIKISQLYLGYNYGFNHFSFGALKTPNKGLNFFTRMVTMGIYTGQQKSLKPQRDIERPGIENKNEFWFYATSGFKEQESNKKRYGFVNTSVNYSRRLGLKNKLGIGLDFTYDPTLEITALDFYNYVATRNINFRPGINVSHEFVFDRFSFLAEAGSYLKNRDYYYSWFYYKGGCKIYFKNFFGIFLVRANPTAKADMVEWGVGYSL